MARSRTAAQDYNGALDTYAQLARVDRADAARTAEVARVLESFGAPHQGPGTGATHIFNLGHGISQYTPPEHVTALVEAVHSHSRKLRQR